MTKKRKILISVTDKRYLDKFRTLIESGTWEIISTGGTAKTLIKAGVPCTPIEAVTRFPEMLDGRLKTLHPNIFGGILADRSKQEHLEVIAQHGIFPIDVVVVNLYDFEEKPGIENIDIGGPSLVRAAAKNGASVTVVVDPDDYEPVIDEITQDGDTGMPTRERLAIKAFHHTANYDRMIAEWMDGLQPGKLFAQSEATSAH